MVRAAIRVPAAVGEKDTDTVQLWPAFREAGQELESAKSPAFEPVMVMPAMLRAALPVLEIVTVWEELSEPIARGSKFNLAADAERKAPFTPVPERGTTSGLLLVVSVRVSVPARAPTADGVNWTLMEQFAP